jgi:predicted regulator of Ras-like GTPase activity (Roadblock/LC7/MglB family)
MPGIHDVVEALGRRDGVDAVIILGNDGLPIDSHVAPGTDPELLSALVPGVVQAGDQLGHHAHRGGLTAGVLEYDGGFAVVQTLAKDVRLLVLVKGQTNIGPLLYDLARHRPEIAGLL